MNRYRFDMLTCFFVLYDCFMVPYKISIGLSKEIQDKLHYLEPLITLIFIIDVIVCFRKAFISDKTGDHITCPKLIAIRYLKFFFWIDLLGCIPFDLFTENKILRLIPLLKTIRFKHFRRRVHLLGISQRFRSHILIFQLIVTILIIIHWTTCFFHYAFISNHNIQIEWMYKADSHLGSDYKIELEGRRKPIFKFSYWIP